MAVSKVANHAHCVQCGRAIPFGEKVCSSECENEIDEANKQRRKMMMFTYGLLIVGFLLLVVGPAFLER